MSTRTQLAALLANEQVLLSDEAVAQMSALAESLADRLNADTPVDGSFITIGMDWTALEIGRLYRVPASEWTGEGRAFFDDASDFMRGQPAGQQIQVEFNSDPIHGVITVKRLR